MRIQHARLRRSERRARIALLLTATLGYFAFLRAFPLAWPAGLVFLALPYLDTPFRRILGRLPMGVPPLVPQLVQVLPYLWLPADLSLLGLCAAAGLQGHLLCRSDDDRIAAWSLAAGPVLVLTAMASAPGTEWLVIFPLSVASGVGTSVLLQARYSERWLAARAPKVRWRNRILDVDDSTDPHSGHAGHGHETLRGLAFNVLPLSLMILCATPLVLVLLTLVSDGVAELSAVEQSSVTPTEENRDREREQRAGATGAREAFDQIFPTGVNFTGQGPRPLDALVMRVAANRRDGRGPEYVGPLYLRGMLLDTITEEGAQFSGGTDPPLREDGDDGDADGWTQLATMAFDPRSDRLDLSIEQYPLFVNQGARCLLFGALASTAIALPEVYFDPEGLMLIAGVQTDWLNYAVRTVERRAQHLDLNGLRSRVPDPRYLQVPERSDAMQALHAAATRITAGARDDVSRVTAIVDHFHENFEYSLETDTFPGLPGLVDFLARRTGHCTYFASSAALMLRSLGIPVRIATGFVATDCIAEGGYYAVTRKAGHVWIEVCLEDLGWVTFDPTPPEARAAAWAAAEREALEGLWSWTRDVGSNLRQWITSGGASAHIRDLRDNLLDAPRALRESVGNRPALLGVLPALLLTVWFVLRMRDRSTRGAGTRPRRDTRADSHHERLLRALARQGFHKGPAQTMREFAKEVQTAGVVFAPLQSITETLYRARYGTPDLTPPEEEAIRTFLRTVSRAGKESSG